MYLLHLNLIGEKNGGIFAELKYLGSFLENSISEKCYTQFYDVGFIVTISSSIFNSGVAFV